MKTLKAADVMSEPVITVDGIATIREAAELLSSSHISGALVVGPRGEPIGVISLFDIVSYLAGLDRPAGASGGFYQASYPSFAEDEDWLAALERPEENPLADTRVAELMAPSVIGVRPDASLESVAALMARKRIHRVFVRGGRNGPVGVISSIDLLGVMGGVRAQKPHASHRR